MEPYIAPSQSLKQSLKQSLHRALNSALDSALNIGLTQVKLRGFRIEVEEIEAVLLSSDFVKAAAVTVTGNPPRLVAWLCLHCSSSCGKTVQEEEEVEDEEASLLLEEGGDLALRVTCLERMPIHQVPFIQP